MNKAEALELWAPHNSPWSGWTKPTLFSFMKEPLPELTPPSRNDWKVELSPEAAVLVEMPGREAVAIGLQLAASGYRPIPLFNACPYGVESSGAEISAASVIEVVSIVRALEKGTQVLRSIDLAPLAPPAFLLDADRSNGPMFPVVGMFDNRSTVRQSDLPTASFMQKAGIRRIVLIRVAGTLRPDLRAVLLDWQGAGLKIQIQTPGINWSPQNYAVRPPHPISRIWDRLTTLFSYRTDSAGSFGKIVRGSSG